MKAKPAPGCRSIWKRCSAGPAPKSTPTRCKSTVAARRERFLGGNLETVSNIEALPTTRLYRLYFEQSLFNDRASVRLGQIAADDEFITSETASGLINGTFGWPALDCGRYPRRRPGLSAAAARRAAAGQAGPRSYLARRRVQRQSRRQELSQRRSAGMRPARGLVPVQRRHIVDRAKPRTTSTAARRPPGCRGSYKLGGWYETGPFPWQLDPARQQPQQRGRVRRRRSGDVAAARQRRAGAQFLSAHRRRAVRPQFPLILRRCRDRFARAVSSAVPTMS